MQARALFAALLMLVVCGAWAQEAARTRFSFDRRGVAPGLSRGEAAFNLQTGVADLAFVEADLRQMSVSASLVTPLRGIHAAVSLEELGLSVDGTMAWALVTAPSLGESGEITGLHRARGSLLSWPAGDMPHVYLYPEGTVRLGIPPADTGNVELADGTRLTLRSINGAPPGEPGEASVYTGTLGPNDTIVRGWNPELLLVVLEPAARGSNLHRLFDGDARADRRLIPRRIRDRSRLDARTDEVTLALHAPVSPELMALMETGTHLTVTVEMEDEERLAEAVFPAGQPVMLEGEVAADAGTRSIANGLALDRANGRMMVLGQSLRRGRGSPVNVATAVQFLAEQEYRDLFLAEGQGQRIVPNLKDTRQSRDAASQQTRVALVFSPRPMTLSLPGTDGDLHRVRGIVVEGMRGEFLANTSRALTDQRILPHASLTHFWAAPLDLAPSRVRGREASVPNSVRIALPRRLPVAAVELFHAEMAGFSAHFNLKSYRISGRTRRDALWQTLTEVRHESPVRRERVILQDSPELMELRLEFLEPTFLTGGDIVRLAEIIVWSPEREIR